MSVLDRFPNRPAILAGLPAQHTPLSLVSDTQPRKLTQTERIIRLLKARGNFGASNRELNSIAYRYSARIDELRKDGYFIETIRDSAGLFRYILKREPES